MEIFIPKHNAGIPMRVSVNQKGFGFSKETCEELSLMTTYPFVQLSYDEPEHRVYFRFTETPVESSMLLRRKPSSGARLQQTRFFSTFGIDITAQFGTHNLYAEGESYYIDLR